MKRSRTTLIAISLLLICAITLNITGCMTVSAENLMDGVTPERVSVTADLDGGNAALADFAVRLFRASVTDGKNTLISPLSVMCALAMTMNGAEGETLAEMEATLGMTKDEVNAYLYTYINALAQGEKYKLSVANSIWFTSDEKFSVNQSFLQTNANYYSADIYKAPFDRNTLRDINLWVKERTDGMIPKILDDIPDSAVMYLVNALAFEAEWASVYEKNQVRDGVFTTEDGKTQNVKMMYDTVGRYLEDEYATGFIRYYSGAKYAFVALLPNEDVSVSEYISTLDGESLYSMLSTPNYQTVVTSLPKFESEYSQEMSDILESLGMTSAFDPKTADFSELGSSAEGNVFISRILHKTYISVGEKGTRAGAATVIEMDGAAAPDSPEEIKYVYLDRPFVYMLIDCETNTPFFIGTTMSVAN